jgi:hypothetical protein
VRGHARVRVGRATFARGKDRVVRYVRHYNEHRPHRGLALRAPLRPTASMPSKPATIASIRREEVLGGLIKEYHAA